MILFKKVREPFGWLSNMSPHAVNDYRTAEAFFQASRFNSVAIQRAIKDCTSPMTAKMIAKANASSMVITPRSAEDLALMRRVVRAKIEQHDDLRIALLRTGNELIVEDVSARPNESGLFWGAVPTNGGLRGQNHLGRIWMELRSEVK